MRKVWIIINIYDNGIWDGIDGFHDPLRAKFYLTEESAKHVLFNDILYNHHRIGDQTLYEIKEVYKVII